MTFETETTITCDGDGCDASIVFNLATRSDALAAAKGRGWAEAGPWGDHHCPECAGGADGRGMPPDGTTAAAICAVLADADGPLGVTRIHARLDDPPSVPTVYRRLDTLETAGCVEAVATDPAKYAPASGAPPTDAAGGDAISHYRELSAEAFADRVTAYETVGAAADGLGISAKDLLELAGHHGVDLLSGGDGGE